MWPMKSLGLKFLKTAAPVVLLVFGLASLAAAFGQAGTKQRPKVSAKDRVGQVDRRTRNAKAQAAQNPASAQNPAGDESIESADVSITATVRAGSLRFDIVPNPTVEFPGKPDRITVWEAERENLPTPVQPGVTYRNIGIRLRIISRFRDIERIVAEALGEIPATDEVSTPLSKPSTPPEPSPSPTPQRERR